MKRPFLFYVLMICFPVFLSSERITKVAILDYSRILSSFHSNSRQARQIEELKTDFASEIRKLQEEIQGLEERRLEAIELENNNRVLRLDDQIQKRKNYYQEYIRVRGNQIRELSENLGSSNALASEILKEIQFVAESNGYSVVLDSADPNLLWWNYEVDITDLVLQRLAPEN